MILYNVRITTPKGLTVSTVPTTDRASAWEEYRARVAENKLNGGLRRVQLIRYQGATIMQEETINA